MNTTTTQTRYTLHDETPPIPSDEAPAFLGADNDLDHVVNEARRLVTGRLYRKLQIRNEANEVVVRVHRTSGEVWVSARLFRSATAEVPADLMFMEIPGIDWSQF
jgi:hypothetical protein